MIMIVKTPGSQMGSPKAPEEGGEEVGGGRWESGERSEVQARSTLTSTTPKARSRSEEVATLDEVPRISLTVAVDELGGDASLPSSACIAFPRLVPFHKTGTDFDGENYLNFGSWWFRRFRPVLVVCV